MEPFAPAAYAGATPSRRDLIEDWIPVTIGLLALFLPSFYTFFTEVWSREDQAHGPIILALSLWLLYQKRAAFLAPVRPHRSAPGWCLFAAGMLCYVIGRSQQILAFEMGSFVLVTVALTFVALRVQARMEAEGA